LDQTAEGDLSGPYKEFRMSASGQKPTSPKVRSWRQAVIPQIAHIGPEPY
jgi:hypothetical protein